MLIKKHLKIIYSDKGPLFRFFWPITHYIVINIFITVSYFYFHVLNKTIVRGKKNVPRKPNTMLLSNHQSMIDSFLVGMGVYYPESLIRTSIIPWSPAAEENFYRNKFLSWLADNWKCIPVKKGRKDLTVVNKMKLALETSPLIIFPEGTRTRNTKIGDGRAGSGLVILETWPSVIPVCIDGMDKILPVGTNTPRIFKKIYILYG